MELNRHICTQLIEKAKSVSQITLDDDYIVRDNKPDAVRIIYSNGTVLVEDVRVANQGVWITGKLLFSALYQSDDEDYRLESVSGEVPFQEKVVMDEVEEGDEVMVDMDIEDLSVGIINSRKLVIRAVVNVMARNLEAKEEEISCAIMELGYEQKTVDKQMLCLTENIKEQLRMQRELLIPNSRSNIGQITFYQVDFRNQEIELLDDQMQVKMDAYIWVLYRSETNGEYECYETVLPLNGEVDVNSLRGDEIFWAKLSPVEVEMDIRSDYDGENRMFGLDMIFSLEVQIYREENCQILEDAYAMDKELLIERKKTPISQLLMKNVSKIRLLEQEQLAPNQQKILQICGSSGKVSIDRVHKRENGIHVEGVLKVHILYNTADDLMPYAHAESTIPFEQFMEIDGFGEDTTYWVDGNTEQLQVSLLDNLEFEVKALIQIAVMAIKREYISNIIAIDEEELDEELLLKQPGMIGYVRRDGEDLWDVAKKYHASAENMIEVGNKILVVKQIGR